ncbi:GNAT family N-acetyltransferase [Tsukamurella tyrosinosolvens]|uniref:GNAT family N-acetyltransferase n=1 Tax=Tsukamurella tyrosinosolvens TaxID=57704 RepID=UPI002DD444E8|nr:GNAT family N-acetyltransferase [Tsukamurella tyrosinosolvens]MEC4613678.1 GNAT family N-acetyltransferase [Tsukamurella tyrosinosolvens]
MVADEALVLPVVTTRLRLRPYEYGDADWLHRVFSRPDVALYLLDPPWTRADAERKLAERRERTDLDSPSGSLSLVAELDGAPIGAVTLWRTGEPAGRAEIGWTFDPERHGHGYAREAARALLDIAFDHYRLHRVAAQMDARNTASARVAEAIGMRREAHLRRDFHLKGEWTDTVVYAALRDDR